MSDDRKKVEDSVVLNTFDWRGYDGRYCRNPWGLLFVPHPFAPKVRLRAYLVSHEGKRNLCTMRVN